MDLLGLNRTLLHFALFRWLRSCANFLRPVRVAGVNNVVVCDCKTSKRLDFHIFISGNNNVVRIAPSCQLYNTNIFINGDGNEVIIEAGVKIQKGQLCVAEGGTLRIGAKTTCQEINAYATQKDIIIGEDCLFSYGIVVRNYDGHKIIDATTKGIVNSPDDIKIGNHVWVSQNVVILKDVHIGDGAIVGVGAVVTRDIPSNSVAAGVPAKVVKGNRDWLRH